jgi:hypothetical protein
VTGGDIAAAVLHRSATAIVNVARIICDPFTYHFVIAVWRAKETELINRRRTNKSDNCRKSANARSIAPIVGGAVAQAWSEFEGIQRNARIDEFFAEFRTRLEALEADAPLTPSLRVGGHQTL